MNKKDIKGTRSASFEIINQNGTRRTQKLKGLEAIRQNGATTSRQLMKLLDTERTNCTRIIKDLEIENRIKVSHAAKCTTTGRTVNYYVINKDDPSVEQAELFPTNSLTPKHQTI